MEKLSPDSDLVKCSRCGGFKRIPTGTMCAQCLTTMAEHQANPARPEAGTTASVAAPHPVRRREGEGEGGAAPLPSIAGRFDRSLADFERSCLVHLDEEQRRARNADTMAAAPELLAALKALRNNVDRDLSGFWTESTSNFMQQADAAIAKAEGRQP